MLESGFPSKTFSGVRFALVGFNPIDGNSLRSKLLSGGGVDAGQHSQTCTHLIVDKLVYDDPVCAAARSSGKVVVTGSWVDHSFDIGMLIDANSVSPRNKVLYRPLRDLNGIPGSDSLVVCLTGYQRQDREDIMAMVDLMGGQFLKPLVANRVTHLICYKFEGEKYELAKRMKKIKLVNHRWLEDCLKNWNLLPEDGYEISGYELEMMEASARDSEDEAEDASVKRANNSPLGLRVGAVTAVGLSKSGGKDIPVVPSNSGAQDGSSLSKDNWLTPKKMDMPLEAMVATDAVAAQQHNYQRASTVQDTSNHASPVPVNKTSERGMETDDSTSVNMSIRRHSSLATYSRKTLKRSPETSTLENESSEANGTLRMDDRALKASNASHISASKSSYCVERTTTLFEDLDKTDKLHGKASPPLMPQAKFTDGSVSSKGSRMVQHNREACIPPPASLLLQELRTASPKENLTTVSSTNDPTESGEVGHKAPASVLNTELLSSNVAPVEDAISTAENIISICARNEIPERSSTEPMAGNILLQDLRSSSPKQNLRVLPNISDHTEGREVAHKLDVSDSATRFFNSSVPREADIWTPETVTLEGAVDEAPEGSVTEPVMRRSSTSPGSGLDGMKHQLETELPKKTTAPRKSLGTRVRKKNPISKKGSIYLSEPTNSKDERTDCLYEGKPSAPVTDSGNQKEISSPALNTEALSEMAKHIDSETEALKRLDSEDNKSSAPEEKDHLVNQDKMQAKASEEADADVEITMVEPERNDVPTKDPSDGASELEVDKNKRKRTREATVGKDSLQSGEKESSSTAEVGKSSVKKTKKSRKKHDAKANDAVMKDISGNSANEREKFALENISGKVSSGGGDQSSVAGETLARKEAETKDTSNAAVQLGVDKHKGKRRKEAIVAKNKLQSGKKRSPSTVELGKTSVKKAKSTKKEDDAKVNDTVMKDIGTNSAEEKENMAVDNKPGRDKSPVPGKPVARNEAAKSAKTGTKADKVSKQLSSKPLASRKALQGQEQEPKFFIVSGPRSQRKEYQQIIKRLKGKCCRDSHQWSYQATHFISPEIRRTEKFLAAAASGSWILKTDYVADSKEAGKLLPEEPYEWHSAGLSADGAINLEAPRKWRLVREQTGHGALYGMRVVVYGDCSIPSLDTLKRAVKAGDGTILATAPPYTRFLNQNTHFALISPGMARDDVWIEELIRHEIPCVLADYLVEYVCKPGYPLDKHVLYNTNSWAERSFKKLQHSAQE
ncbi:unnamed protein product [Thlaspi arvense]|uniref:BRCT domain-containing protein n=1 Tax=Thlaspi arvense TaxID=13288 RepID=A0AAU9SWU0_THLAR|nr:unnamed protein product [Thlaspi arvense]